MSGFMLDHRMVRVCKWVHLPKAWPRRVGLHMPSACRSENIFHHLYMHEALLRTSLVRDTMQTPFIRHIGTHLINAIPHIHSLS